MTPRANFWNAGGNLFLYIHDSNRMQQAWRQHVFSVYNFKHYVDSRVTQLHQSANQMSERIPKELFVDVQCTYVDY